MSRLDFLEHIELILELLIQGNVIEFQKTLWWHYPEQALEGTRTPSCAAFHPGQEEEAGAVICRLLSPPARQVSELREPSGRL